MYVHVHLLYIQYMRFLAGVLLGGRGGEGGREGLHTRKRCNYVTCVKKYVGYDARVL